MTMGGRRRRVGGLEGGDRGGWCFKASDAALTLLIYLGAGGPMVGRQVEGTERKKKTFLREGVFFFYQMEHACMHIVQSTLEIVKLYVTTQPKKKFALLGNSKNN